MAIKTNRLVLRSWKDSDLAPFCRMCADQDVMRFFPSVLTRQESIEMAQKIRSLINERGWGFWAVEVPGCSEFIGFVGLHMPKATLPFSPCVEVGWRLSKEFWGQGYATEAAKASIEYGFTELKLDEIVAFTAAINSPSIKVMERIGMANTGLDFEHPDVPASSALRHHVLYKISRSAL